MAASTVGEARHTLMLVLHFGPVVLMTVVACVVQQAAGVAGAALAASAFMIHGEGVRAIVGGWQPSAGVVAGGTVQPEQTSMRGRIGMAAGTGKRRAGERSATVAALTRRETVGTGQRKPGQRMVEGDIYPFRRLMAG